MRHDLRLLVNPLWSPLYPFLIGVATTLLKPSWNWELPVVHAVNFFVFLGAMASFEFLLRQIVAASGAEEAHEQGSSLSSLPAWALELIGYSLFAWSTFVLIGNGLRRISPDLCVAAFVYLAAGFILKVRAGGQKTPMFIAFGLALGLGYLAKTVMFPMAFVFMASSISRCENRRRLLIGLAATLIVFISVSAPLFVSISEALGRLTFGESGRLNYAWHVNQKDWFPFYSSRPASYLLHPMNRIYENPNVFEFGKPFKVTYSLWFAPWYWNAGVTAHFDLRRQIRLIGRSLLVDYYGDLVAPVWGLIGGYFILLFMSPSLSSVYRNFRKAWPLLLTGASALALYSVVHAEGRYIAPFAVLIWLGLLLGIRLPLQPASLRISTVASCVMAFPLLVLSLQFAIQPPSGPGVQDVGGVHYEIAQFLGQSGVRPGEAVAIVGNGFDNAFWARLARVHIVAQIPSEEAGAFWRADPRTQAEVFEAMAAAGAKAVISQDTPPNIRSADWQRFGEGTHSLHFLSHSGP